MGYQDGTAAGQSGGQFSISSMDLLIGNLAVADLIVTIFCNVTDVIWAITVQWFAGNSMCKLAKYLQLLGLYLSTYVVWIRCNVVESF